MIDAYKFTQLYQSSPTDPALPTLPMKKLPPNLSDALDALTHACEAGKLDEDEWPQQCFASKAVYKKFLEQLADFDDEHRIHDRWYAALSRLASNDNECGFVTSAEIAELLEDAAPWQ